MKIEITATKREVQGTGASRRLRRANEVPAVVYGGGVAPTMISLGHNDIYYKLRNEAFHASILDMKLGSESFQVLLRDYTMHPFRQQVQHVDFQRVAPDKEIHMKVPLHFVNADKSDAVKHSGGIVGHVMNDIEVICLPKHLPEFVEVDLTSLTTTHSIHVADIKLPANVRAALTVRGDNPSVATLTLPAGAKEEDTAAPVAAEVPATAQKKKDEPAAAAAPAKKK
jgi:large subunit ribosomal protein L25